jgi:hypothetical protein
LSYTGKNNLTISHLTINGGSSPCLTLTNCNNVYINACTFQNSSNVAILLNNCSNVTIQTNTISNVAAGVYAVNCPNGGIRLYTNNMKNMTGGTSNNGAFVEFLNVGGANNTINGNKMQNFSGQSNSIFAIDLVQSKGTSSSPITVVSNQIEGGGPNSSSVGIMLGHHGGSYQTASSNTLVNPGSIGASIAGGDHISITNNQIFASKQSFTNVGISVYAQGGTTITSSTVSGNQVNWTNKSGVQSSNWLASGMATPSGWSSNSWGASISASILPSTLF